MPPFKKSPKVVTPTSSFHDLTQFLVCSFQEKDHKVVEEILVKRKKGLLDGVAKLKLRFQKVKEERDNLQKEIELSKQNSDRVGSKVHEKFEALEKKNRDLEYKFVVLKRQNGELKCKVEVLEGQNDDLESKLDELRVKNGKLQNKIEVLEVKNEDIKYDIEILERQNEELQRELGELEEKNGDVENKIEVLEEEKLDLEKKNEIRKEWLEKELVVVEERLANLKGIFYSSISSGSDSGGGIVIMTDSHDKASNWKSCHTKSQASPRNPSSKTPSQVENRGAEGIFISAQLGEGGGCIESNINFKRKRSIDGSDDDHDSSKPSRIRMQKTFTGT